MPSPSPHSPVLPPALLSSASTAPALRSVFPLEKTSPVPGVGWIGQAIKMGKVSEWVLAAWAGGRAVGGDTLTAGWLERGHAGPGTWRLPRGAGVGQTARHDVWVCGTTAPFGHASCSEGCSFGLLCETASGLRLCLCRQPPAHQVSIFHVPTLPSFQLFPQLPVSPVCKGPSAGLGSSMVMRSCHVTGSQEGLWSGAHLCRCRWKFPRAARSVLASCLPL